MVRPKKIQRKEIKLKLSPFKSKISLKLKSPSPELVSQIESTSPDLSTKIGSTSPDRVAENGSTQSDFKLKLKFKASMSGSKVVKHSTGFSSPSLKPVRVKNIIDSFEQNVKLRVNDAKFGRDKEKLKDAFGVLMSSKGDTLQNPPKSKKPKRNTQEDTGAKRKFMDGWLKKRN